MTEKSGFLSRFLPFFYVAVAIVAVWQIALILTGVQLYPSLLPSPVLTGETFIGMVANGEIFERAGMSLGRVFTAWLMSACIAIPLGLAMGRFGMFERILDPVVELFRPISSLAWIPTAIIWFGIGEAGGNLRHLHRRLLSHHPQHRGRCEGRRSGVDPRGPGSGLRQRMGDLPQDHSARGLWQEHKKTRFSFRQVSHLTRRNPCSRRPHSRYAFEHFFHVTACRDRRRSADSA